jgi:guanylate kinase
MIVSLTGPSAIGKGYIRQALLAYFPFLRELVWLTTRPLRPDERLGSSNRKSVSIEEFRTLEGSSGLVLVQNIHGHLYGVARKDLEIDVSSFYLTELHVDNLTIARRLGLSLVPIALVPAELGLLRARLARRGTESSAEAEQRLAVAVGEVREILAQRHLFARIEVVDESSEAELTTRLIEFLTPVLEGSS